MIKDPSTTDDNEKALTTGVIITALDETWSVRETIEGVLGRDDGAIVDVIMATAPYSTPECRAVVREMVDKYPGLVREHVQSELKGVGGAIRECSSIVKGDWVVLMAADLETPPERVSGMLERAAQGDVDIVATSRWLDGGGFGDYSKVKLVCNWVFQKFFSILYGAPLTDMTYGFRAYKRELLQNYEWKESGLAFFFESLVKPVRDGKKVVELPVKWKRRQEGVSHIVSSEYLRYFRIGLLVRVLPRSRLLSPAAKQQ